ncbi:MAG: DSD1 family PLP-dependent enzyme, partial [Pseudomonadota bacterium]|nr:DSD1 family PLP-dependent enzyme [Pseudomonadota bacterium]
MKTTRRNLLLGGLAAGAVGSAFLLKPKDHGADHTPYFQQLSKALDDDGISTPSLVIDQQKLRSNIATLKQHIGKRFDYRIVAKSLPSIPLLRLIMKEADTNRLMLFHQPFLSQVAEEIPGADVLMGKPMP